MGLEETILRYLSEEEFCSRVELEQFILLNGGRADTATRLIADWEAQGWIESVTLGEPHLPPLLRLTDQAFQAQPRLRRAT